MRKSGAAKKKVESEEPQPRVRGEKPVERALAGVKPNEWNPNHMTPFLKESLKHGLLHDGWLRSQSLLIWGTDEKGKVRNVIIDGEHRWTVGQELGFKKGPMVLLHGLTEAEAKALTIKMNVKRGEANDLELGVLLRDLEASLDSTNLALSLGIEQDDLMQYLAQPAVVIPGGGAGDDPTPPGELPSGSETHVRMVQLFFSKEQHVEFDSLVKKAAIEHGTKDVSATVLEVMRARPAAKPRS
jgi:hypothetical protein